MTTPGSETITDFMSDDALSALTSLIFRPSEFSVRILELVDLHEDSPKRQTIREYAGLTGNVLVPIAFPKRGQLIDTIRIEQSPSNSDYALSGELTIAAMRAILGSIVKTVSLSAASAPLVTAMCNYVTRAQSAGDALVQVDLLRGLFEKENSSQNLTPDQVRLITAFQFIARRQPLLIPCRASQLELKITSERDVPYVEMQHRGVREAARGAVALAPDFLRFDVPLATRTQSYHFRLRAPSDYFIRDAQYWRKYRTNVAHDARHMRSAYAPFPKDSRTATGLGSNPTEVAHIQIIRAGEVADARLGIVIMARLAERPLGRVGAAFSRLLIVSSAAWLFLGFGARIVVASNAATTSLLLGLPGLLGVSLIRARVTPRVREPLSARLGSGLAVLSAIASSVVLSVWIVTASRNGRVIAHKTTSYPAPHGVAVAFVLIGVISSVAALNMFAVLSTNSVRYIIALRNYRRAKTI